MLFTDSRLYGLPSFFALSKASNIGLAKASPTITRLLAFLLSVSLNSKSGSNPNCGMVTTHPPASRGIIAPSHIPVPCINGQAGMLTGRLLDSPFSLITLDRASISTFSWIGIRPHAPAVFSIALRCPSC